MIGVLSLETEPDLLGIALVIIDVLGEPVDREISAFCCLVICPELSTPYVAKNEESYNAEERLRVVVLPVAVSRYEKIRFDVESRLFICFLYRVCKDRLIVITPASGQRPFAIIILYQEHLIPVVKDDRSGVTLGSLVSVILSKELGRLFGWKAFNIHRKYLGRDIPYTLKSLLVETVFGIEHPARSKCVKFTRKIRKPAHLVNPFVFL